jgi:hypothetical protein
MTLPPQGWVGRVVAVAIAGLTAIIALTSSDVRLGRVRLAAAAALAAVIATALARAASSNAPHPKIRACAPRPCPRAAAATSEQESAERPGTWENTMHEPSIP